MKQANKNRPNGRHTNNRFGNNNRHAGNVITRNTAFDSSSNAGRVRGTAQQLIDKYLSLAKDAKAQDDRVLHETYLQYADHYVRMLDMAIQNEQARAAAAMAQQQAQQKERALEEETNALQDEDVTSEQDMQDSENHVHENKKAKHVKARKATPASDDTTTSLDTVAEAVTLPVDDSDPLAQDAETSSESVAPQPVVIEIPE